MIFYRLVPTIEILLTLEPNEDEKKLYGYQEPLDESEVQELEESVDRPRFRPKVMDLQEDSMMDLEEAELVQEEPSEVEEEAIEVKEIGAMKAS